MSDSPYLLSARRYPLVAQGDGLSVREAISPFGMILRYQERAPLPAGAPEPDWCMTEHSIFILEGRIRYQSDDHVVEAGPGDMLHIPAGVQHRHKPFVVGSETVRYFLTEFD